MAPDIHRRKLLAYAVSSGIGGLGFATVTADENRTENETDGHQRRRPCLSVERVVRVDASTYRVTYRYVIPDDTDIEESRFTQGSAATEPPQEIEDTRDTFTARWTPGDDRERLTWELQFPDSAVQASTPPHQRVRRRWTLSLERLRERLAQFDPSGISVRTGAESQRTMYLHGSDSEAMFRIWDDGLVSYQTDRGWWEVDVQPDQLIPATGDTGPAPDQDAQQNNQYTFTMNNSPYDGSQWLSALLREGTHWGVNVFYIFPSHGDATLGLDPKQPDEVYSRISFRLTDSWEQSGDNDTCKIYWAGANLSAGRAGKGGNRPSGDDGWSVRIYTNGHEDPDRVSIGAYVYHLDQNGRFGDLWQWPGDVEIGQWNQLETYVRLNSVSDEEAMRDGALNAYLNGETQMERADLRWRTTEELGFDRLGPGAYWGGTELAPRDNYVFYDDFRFDVSGG